MSCDPMSIHALLDDDTEAPRAAGALRGCCLDGFAEEEAAEAARIKLARDDAAWGPGSLEGQHPHTLSLRFPFVQIEACAAVASSRRRIERAAESNIEFVVAESLGLAVLALHVAVAVV